MEFTTQQESAIAEFAHAFETDTLIKPEAEALIKVFQDHNIPEAFVADVDVDDCLMLLFSNTTIEQRSEIMKKYYSGSL
jgi:hypothetical protein